MSDSDPSRQRIRSLRDLPQSIAPPRDLWPAIEASIGRDARALAPLRRRAWRHAAGLAAAVAVLALGVWIGRSSLGPTGTAPLIAQQPAASGAAVPAAFSPGGAYTAERERLLRDLEARLAALPPDSREQVQESLATIRRSIEELKVALGEDPSNVLLHELLVNAYQNEMRVLVAVQEANASRQET